MEPCAPLQVRAKSGVNPASPRFAGETSLYYRQISGAETLPDEEPSSASCVAAAARASSAWLLTCASAPRNDARKPAALGFPGLLELRHLAAQVVALPRVHDDDGLDAVQLGARDGRRRLRRLVVREHALHGTARARRRQRVPQPLARLLAPLMRALVAHRLAAPEPRRLRLGGGVGVRQRRRRRGSSRARVGLLRRRHGRVGEGRLVRRYTARRLAARVARRSS